MNRLALNVLLAFGLLFSPAMAKFFEGDFQLSPSKPGHIIGSFALSPGHKGSIQVTLSTPEKAYEDDRSVRLRLFKDEAYTEYQKANSCYQKIYHTSFSETVSFHKENGVHVYEFDLALVATRLLRPHYYYFVVDDCSLEMYSGGVMEGIPRIHYSMKALNDDSHLSADEMHLRGLHIINLLVSGIMAALMGVVIVRQLAHNDSVHAAMFLVMAAGAFDAVSSLCEILNLVVYSNNGIGMPFVDSISTQLSAVCDSLIAVMLLSIAAGWTLPTDVIPMQNKLNPNGCESLLSSFQSPLRGSFAATAMTIGIFVAHAVLAQWGCLYENTFDSYHDFEHLPGKLLMGLRITMGLCLVVSCLQTRQRCPKKQQTFYLRLAVIGSLWFQSLPFVTWVCNNAVPFYLRLWTVGTWGVALHCSSIALLSWLVTTQNSSFHKYASDLPSLSCVMPMGSGNGIWKVGYAKIRLD
jgi:hypothetical protein